MTLRHIKGTSGTILWILKPYNIRVALKPTTTLRHVLTNVKDKDKPNRQGKIYKIKCSYCQASCIGETGRNLNKRLTKHKRATRNGVSNNHIAGHHQLPTELTGTLLNAGLACKINCFQRMILEDVTRTLQTTYSRYKRSLTDRLDLTNNRRIETY